MYAAARERSDEPGEAARVRAAQQGDPVAAEALFRRYLTMARSLALRNGCRPDELEDVLQEAVAQALEWLPSLRKPEAFSSWFGQIVVFVSWHQGRQARRRGLLGRALDGAAGDRDRSLVTPERVVEARQISSAIGRLPRKVQEVVRMRHLEGLRIREIARRIDVSPASVKRYLATAASALRALLERDLVQVGERLPEPARRRRDARRYPVLLALFGGAGRLRDVAGRAGRGRLLARGLRFAALGAGLLAALAGSSTALLREPKVVGGNALATAPLESPSPGAVWVAEPALRPGEHERAEPPAAGRSIRVGDGTWTLTSLPAETLVDSVGINLRLAEDGQDEASVRAALRDLGVRHVMDVAPSRVDWLARLEPQGIQAGLAVPAGTDAHAVVARLPSIEAVTLMLFPRGISPLEDWARRQRAWMEATYRGLKTDAATRRVAVIGATASSDERREALGDLSGFVDFGAAGAPSRALPPGGAMLDGTLLVYRRLYPQRPLIVPQVSHSTAACDECVDEARQARYLTRTLLENHGRGIVRTYAAYLFDRRAQPVEYRHGMGIVRHDGEPKAAFHALARTLRLFGDPGPPAREEELRLELDSEPEHLQAALYRRSDGRLLLAIWLAVASGPEALTTPVVLRLPPGTRPLRVHGLISGDVASAAADEDGRVSLVVSEDPIVLEIAGP